METCVPTFGFSAFLKLISSGQRPQRTIVRQRLRDQSDGYDFHRSLKLRARRYLIENEPLEDVLATVAEIPRLPERSSARSGLERLGLWRARNPGVVVDVGAALYESPGKTFKVNYTPNFGIEIAGRSVAVHIWNTGKPDLDKRMMFAALSLFKPIYAMADDGPDDLSVLSLRDPNAQLFRLSEVEDHTEAGLRLARRLDDLFEEVRGEPPRPARRPKDQPGTRPLS